MNILTKVKLILINPQRFWQQSEQEIGVSGVISYFFVITPVAALLFLLKNVLSLRLGFMDESTSSKLTILSEKIGLNGELTLIVAIVLFFISFFLTSFVLTGLIHVLIKLFGGQGGYDKTYQAYIYGTTPQLLVLAIPILSFVGPVWMLYLHLTGLSKFHKITVGKSLVALIAAAIFLFIIIFSSVFSLLSAIGPANSNIPPQQAQQAQQNEQDMYSDPMDTRVVTTNDIRDKCPFSENVSLTRETINYKSSELRVQFNVPPGWYIRNDGPEFYKCLDGEMTDAFEIVDITGVNDTSEYQRKEVVVAIPEVVSAKTNSPESPETWPYISSLKLRDGRNLLFQTLKPLDTYDFSSFKILEQN